MSVFKCKICGGTIEFNAGDTIGVCDSCGTKQTLPRLDSDRKTNLYDRANHFRRNNEFDKAMSIYENILNEDPADAEAYWSVVLCRYGIEYVEDPATRKWIPTVNRAQFTSIFADEDYKAAIAHADRYQREVYETEAHVIDEIQKGILDISSKEKPFDVFICYKETDANGRRTQDSVLANELYHQLTNEGFKVFFSRITLEDKLGTAYEPYIFAALNSAKAMVVLGTRPEYFNAVWVKNEWSRYLSLVKQSGGKKVLIPAYRGMDPYDLPEEFSHLQAQDMSKLGFMQDLIRGIRKIVKADEPKQIVRETSTIPIVGTVAPLLKRAFMFLEDGEWKSADEYCEKVLDLDPENAKAYLGKLMANLRVHKQEDLKSCEQPFDQNNNYQKAVRFGGEKIAGMLSGYIDHINERNKNAHLTGIYNNAVTAMNSARTESSFKAVAATFRTIPGFKDADSLAEQCLERAEASRKDDIYTSARSQMIGNTVSGYEAAIKALGTISGWKDADEQIHACWRKIIEIKTKEEADRLERERQAEEKRIATEKTAKKRKKIAAIVIPIIAACIAFVIVLTMVIIPNQKYTAAVELYTTGKYEEAIAAFTELDGYRDSATQIEKCETAVKESKYAAATELYTTGKYEEAIAAFTALAGYKDSITQIEKCKTAVKDAKYAAAAELYTAGKYKEAIAAFTELDGYKDSAAKIKEIKSKYYKQLFPDASVGSTVFFGSYEQDNNTSNGKEDIEWIVLAKEDSRILIISKYALDCQQYNASYKNITWETCSLRSWLNKTFLHEAFSTEEQKLIPMVKISADRNPFYSTNPGKSTTDQVFLLSIEEAKKYFRSDADRQCKATQYAISINAYTDADGYCVWWLRSPGYYDNNATRVLVIGSVDAHGAYVHARSDAVRPALWIDLESGF